MDWLDSGDAAAQRSWTATSSRMARRQNRGGTALTCQPITRECLWHDQPDRGFGKKPSVAGSVGPSCPSPYDFTPGDLLTERSHDGYFHLGDITLRLRVGSSSEWRNFSTAAVRPVTALPVSQAVLAAGDLTSTLPADFPLQLTRTWALESGKLVLRFVLRNKSPEPIQVGALGIPMIFNNVLNDRSLPEAHAKCSFYDPYIGEDAGYLQVTRLNGHGPALLVVPDGKTPFEAYNPILDRPGQWGAKPVFTDPTPRGITFEGFYEWMVHSRAYAENEWKTAQPWNSPSELTLAPGESKTYGLRFLLSDSIRGIEDTLARNGRPVAVGVPGYVVPADINARLFLKYPRSVQTIEVEPQGALSISKDAQLAPAGELIRSMARPGVARASQSRTTMAPFRRFSIS